MYMSEAWSLCLPTMLSWLEDYHLSHALPIIILVKAIPNVNPDFSKESLLSYTYLYIELGTVLYVELR